MKTRVKGYDFLLLMDVGYDYVFELTNGMISFAFFQSTPFLHILFFFQNSITENMLYIENLSEIVKSYQFEKPQTRQRC